MNNNTPSVAWLAANPNARCIAWARFEASGPKVEVLALLGASGYIDRDMTRNEGRAIYKKLRSEGSLPRTDAEAKASRMDARRLQLLIHD